MALTGPWRGKNIFSEEGIVWRRKIFSADEKKTERERRENIWSRKNCRRQSGGGTSKFKGCISGTHGP